MTEVFALQDLNLDLFIQSVDKLAAEVEKSLDENNKVVERTRETALANKKADALFEGMKGLFGIDALAVQMEGDRVHIVVDVCGMRARLTLDLENSSKLCNIKILSDTDSKVDTAHILSACSKLSPPNDIRQAMFYLEGADSTNMIRAHVAELRNSFLVKYEGLGVAATLQSGVTVSMRVHCCYPLVPGGVSVERIDSPDPLSTIQHRTATQEDANSQCFSTLREMMDFVCAKLQ
ncbi:hypothetical protein B484DRAFT_457233 [Ochromonadaceae sp. CCMP2298]|nr:hypothetical protein B484DRAFT_457233 [Ochromonadaceae sp. CCMP2298]